MERDNDLIELGAATVETRGGGVLVGDERIKQNAPGLSDDD